MLAANEAVGELFIRWRRAVIWRNHEPPELESCEQLSQWLSAYGISADPVALQTPKGMGQVIQKIQRHSAATPLSFLCLRTLKQARYAAENRGHFGLASRAYLHFTSPIRRYPDLVTQRLVKKALLQGKQREHDPEAERRAIAELTTLADQSSKRERLAMDIERKVQAIYGAAFMRDHVGEVYTGTIFSIAPFGVFLRLTEPAIEGLLRFESFPEWVEAHPETQRLIGKRHTYCLGDELPVRLKGTSLTRGQIDFEFPTIKARHGRGTASRAPHPRRTSHKSEKHERKSKKRPHHAHR
jgi:ribonuclease R